MKTYSDPELGVWFMFDGKCCHSLEDAQWHPWYLPGMVGTIPDWQSWYNHVGISYGFYLHIIYIITSNDLPLELTL